MEGAFILLLGNKLDKMIKLLLSILLLSFYSFALHAQKFGYVDLDFILNKMPEYKQSQLELETVAKKWQDEIKSMKIEVDQMYMDYKAEEVLLTEDLKEDRLNEIKHKEDSVYSYENKVFGYEGLYFLKRLEVIKPVQEKVFTAVEKVSRDKSLAVMFDKSGELLMIYTNPIHDYTDYVLEQLGLGDKDDTIK